MERERVRRELSRRDREHGEREYEREYGERVRRELSHKVMMKYGERAIA